MEQLAAHIAVEKRRNLDQLSCRCQSINQVGNLNAIVKKQSATAEQSVSNSCTYKIYCNQSNPPFEISTI